MARSHPITAVFPRRLRLAAELSRRICERRWAVEHWSTARKSKKPGLRPASSLQSRITFCRYIVIIGFNGRVGLRAIAVRAERRMMSVADGFELRRVQPQTRLQSS